MTDEPAVRTMEIRTADVTDIHPDPNNPRKKLRDIDALRASIERLGQLEPIVVREVNGGLQLISGARRLAACTVLKRTIEYRIATPEEEREAALQGLVMNIQRDDLTPIERARGIQHVLDLGVTTDEAAAGLSVPVEHVEQASTIAQAKQTVNAVEKASVPMSFDMVLGLAEFEDDADWYNQLLTTAIDSPDEWAYEIEGARQERAKERRETEAVKEWEDKGYQVFVQSAPGGLAARLDSLKDDKDKAITPARHKTCPGRAVWIFEAYDFKTSENRINAIEYCTDPETNGHKPPAHRTVSSAGSATPTRPDDEAATTARRANLAMINAEKVARVVRREFVAKLLARKTPPPGVLRFAVEYMVGYRVSYSPQSREVFIEITGSKDDLRGRGQRSMAETYVEKGTDQHLALGLFAFVVAEIEGAWEPNSWRSERAERMRYLDLLVKCGYTLSLVEKVAVGKAKPDAVLADADKRRAQKAAKK